MQRVITSSWSGVVLLATWTFGATSDRINNRTETAKDISQSLSVYHSLSSTIASNTKIKMSIKMVIIFTTFYIPKKYCTGLVPITFEKIFRVFFFLLKQLFSSTLITKLLCVIYCILRIVRAILDGFTV